MPATLFSMSFRRSTIGILISGDRSICNVLPLIRHPDMKGVSTEDTFLKPPKSTISNPQHSSKKQELMCVMCSRGVVSSAVRPSQAAKKPSPIVANDDRNGDKSTEVRAAHPPKNSAPMCVTFVNAVKLTLVSFLQLKRNRLSILTTLEKGLRFMDVSVLQPIMYSLGICDSRWRGWIGGEGGDDGCDDDDDVYVSCISSPLRGGTDWTVIVVMMSVRDRQEAINLVPIWTTFVKMERSNDTRPMHPHRKQSPIKVTFPSRDKLMCFNRGF